ncbi:MAG: hypothetical protein GY865_06125 [candidate division Zixibacteria bacterium]|nr:hypothetical protein [candidate division Zixibacteria bacterium]
MRCNMLLLFSLLSISFCSVCVAESVIGDRKAIELNSRLDSYDCVINYDTIHLATQEYKDGTISYHKVVGDSLQIINYIKGIKRAGSYWESYFQMANNHTLIAHASIDNVERFAKIDVLTGEIVIFRTLAREGNRFESIKPVGYYSLKNADYLVYEDWRYRKFVLSIDNMNRIFSKHYLIENKNGETLEAKMISKPGRTRNRYFHSILNHDTLYTVWQEYKKKLFAWADFLPIPYSESFLFSKYDGKNWKEPLEIKSVELEEHQFEYPIGVYVINEKFFVFWVHSYFKENKSCRDIYYIYSPDQVNWSQPVQIGESLTQMSFSKDGFWSAVASSDGILHILAQGANDRKTKYYCTFNGYDWRNHGPVIDELSSDEKLRLDNDGNIFIFWRAGQDFSDKDTEVQWESNWNKIFYKNIELIN